MKWGMGMAGIKDIAEAAGVSLSTVSNVINGKRNVGKKTREKLIRDVIAQNRIVFLLDR